jgi:hypothetical protein
MAKGRVVFHDFYCMNCGQRTWTLPRKTSKLHGEFHRKKLYCRFCQTEVNHIEIRNDAEAYEFKELWLEGYFTQETAESIRVCKEGI